jgi:flagellar basal-body rod protein FlgB
MEERFMINNIYAKFDFFQKSLEGLWTRNEIVSNNIANSGSDGYLAKDINFEKVMNEYLDKINNDRYFDSEKIKYSLEFRQGLPVNSDGNNVSIDKEMVSLAETQMKYDLVSKALKYQFNLLNTVISETKG